MYYQCFQIKCEEAPFSFKTPSNSLLADSAFWTPGKAMLAVPPPPSCPIVQGECGQEGGREDTN